MVAPTTTSKPSASAAPVKTDKAEKPKKDPKPLMQRLDEQLTRAVVAKKVTAEEVEKFESRVGKLKLFLQE